jgi:hypothetical protein
MSQENVEVVQAALAAWNAGEMDALRELYDPGAIVRAPEGWPEPGPFVGRGTRSCAGSRGFARPRAGAGACSRSASLACVGTGAARPDRPCRDSSGRADEI